MTQLRLYFMSYGLPYAFLTQGDLEQTQGSLEKNNYNEPYGERFGKHFNTDILSARKWRESKTFFLSKCFIKV